MSEANQILILFKHFQEPRIFQNTHIFQDGKMTTYVEGNERLSLKQTKIATTQI